MHERVAVMYAGTLQISRHVTFSDRYARSDTTWTSGCHSFFFKITKDESSNEMTCFGVARKDVRDPAYNKSSDMWMYRAYNGEIM